MFPIFNFRANEQPNNVAETSIYVSEFVQILLTSKTVKKGLYVEC